MKKTEQFIDSMLPETAALERAVLSDAVNAPHALGEIIPILHEDFFTTKARKDIWRTIVSYYNAGKDLDYFSVANAIGVDLFQTEILNQPAGTGSGAFVRSDAENLRTAACQRRAYLCASEFIRKAVQPGMTEAEILADAEAFAAEVAGPSPLQKEQHIAEVITEIGDELQDMAAAAKEGKTAKVPTGFARLDELFYRGYAPGQLVVLAARPSVGKTAVMLQMAKAAAAAGKAATVFSLEMTAQDLGSRLLYSTGLVRPVHIATGNVEWQLFEKADTELAPLPLYINDFSKSLDDIVARMVQLHKQGRCDIAFIDYLGLFRDCYDFGSAKLYQVIAKITGTLKQVAKRLGIPVVLLSQLNRESVRDKRAPELYDLRDSGSIEQDADIVIMLEAEYTELQGTRLHLYVRKHRQGPKMRLTVLPNATYSAFEEESCAVEEGRTIEREPVVLPEDNGIDEFDEDELPF